ncbi:epoxide hydrolase N-terminal domain-containing protein [Streptomyces flaveolus]|uniref:epoxide hydrolase N-terminal domain-containing protein n=1 Tax=Streptomyces flaveolus TaxID=67297 RepID=UPI00069FAF71|nr:epoxide hydrolase N-terminal domain-containing protein [Streptomyces antibioticus]KOG60216.1 hypothetical protein ADK77_36460 [Streptomyces antibioticus]
MSDSTQAKALEPYKIDVPQDVLDDLKERLQKTRFFDDLDNEEEYYGISTAYLKPLVEYWANGFDWRAQCLPWPAPLPISAARGGEPSRVPRCAAHGITAAAAL